MYPDFKAVNPGKIPLGTVIDDLAPKICLDLKLHYRKLSQTIRTKMKNLSFDPHDLPQAMMDAEDNGNDDGTALEDDAEDEDPRKMSQKIVFPPQHIKTCWAHLMKLPAASRPRFCLQPKMSDSFIDIREDAIMRILWGEEAGQVKDVWDGSPYTANWANAQVGTSFGNVVKMPFIGNRETVRLSDKQQTTYGKRTTTMQERASTYPDIYGQGNLSRYVTDRIKHYRLLHNNSISAQSSSSSSSAAALSSPSPPSLPAPPQVAGMFRYALNNYIRTDGHQLQLLAYDLTKDRQASGRKEFLRRIENQYPTRQAIVDAFGNDWDSVAVIGIDPGEVVSGAFCMRLPDGSVVNLLVRRASLYQPTLAFRGWEQEWRRHHPKAGITDPIDSQLWTRPMGHDDKPTSLFSIHDLENTLHSTNYESWDAVVSAQRQYYELEPILHGFYSSSDWEEAVYEHRMAKLSEMDLAVAGVLRLVDEALADVPVKQRKVLFAVGNGTFKSGLNLTSVHTTFLRRLLQKSTSLGYKAALVDEYLTSTVCPTCVCEGEQTRLAKPSMRVCACTVCKHWIHRDLVGAHNIAIIGDEYLKSLGRPEPLARPKAQAA